MSEMWVRIYQKNSGGIILGYCLLNPMIISQGQCVLWEYRIEYKIDRTSTESERFEM